METSSYPKHPAALWALKSLLLALSIAAIPPGLSMLFDPSGAGVAFPPDSLRHTPFSNYLVPGILLTVCNGILPMIAWFGLWKKPDWAWLARWNPFPSIHWSWTLALVSGIGLMIWIVVQITMIQYSFLQPLMLVWGALIVGLSLLPSVRRYERVHR